MKFLIMINITAEAFTARLKKANSVTKTEFDKKLTSFNTKITLNETKIQKFRRNSILLQQIIIIFS